MQPNLSIHADPAPETGYAYQTFQTSAILPPSCTIPDLAPYPWTQNMWIHPIRYASDPYKMTTKTVIVTVRNAMGIPVPFVRFAWSYASWKGVTPPSCQTGKGRTGPDGKARITVSSLGYGGHNGPFLARTDSPLAPRRAYLGQSEAHPILIL